MPVAVHENFEKRTIYSSDALEMFVTALPLKACLARARFPAPITRRARPRECSDLISRHALHAGKARDVVVKAMLGDQPLPLSGGWQPMEQGTSDMAPS